MSKNLINKFGETVSLSSEHPDNLGILKIGDSCRPVCLNDIDSPFQGYGKIAWAITFGSESNDMIVIDEI